MDDNLNDPSSNFLLSRTRDVSGNNARRVPPVLTTRNGSGNYSLFSSSLPVLPHQKLNISNLDFGAFSTDDTSVDIGKVHNDNTQSALKLPDDDDLFSGMVDDFDLSGPSSFVEDMDEYDLFGSGGGMELDSDQVESLIVGIGKANLGESFKSNGLNQYNFAAGMGSVAGEHPFGEHPSRTLFVRNINSNVEDLELRALFGQFGDIRSLYTATKHRGFVMISYFDIRSARAAMRALQNKPLRRRKLDIHYSIPKDNPSDKDLNQGTLVIFNLDPSVSNDELRRIFGGYGEIKEIRETPHKRHHKFIEFFDVREAEAALRGLNKFEIAGKRIKLEPSRPGGARRSMMQHLTNEFDQDDPRAYRHIGSPIANSPPGPWVQFGSPPENGGMQNFNIAARNVTPVSFKMAPIGKSPNKADFVNSNSSAGVPYKNPNSYPVNGDEFKSTIIGAPNTSAVGALTGQEFLWGSPRTYADQSHAWSSSIRAPGSQRSGEGVLYGSRQAMHFDVPNYRHHIGSAPSGIPMERHFGFYPETPEGSFKSQVLGTIGSSRDGSGFIGDIRHLTDAASPNFRISPSSRLTNLYSSNSPYPGLNSFGFDSFTERIRGKQMDITDNKKQYLLDLDKIKSGQDNRTTLMIKNIPNKYTSNMLLWTIDEKHKGTYDFFYLPIDFKNKCNVGYAFINMVAPSHIASFYEVFNGKRWEKFNSEKVASLAYARIQGRAALISHFQNSSLMNEDKRHRPMLFHSKGPDAGTQEPFPMDEVAGISMTQQDGLLSAGGDPAEGIYPSRSSVEIFDRQHGLS